MGLAGRYFSARDLRFINSVNGELMGDVIQTDAVIFKVAPLNTPANIYGESDPSTGKMFYPGVKVTCLVDRADIEAEYDEFGHLKQQPVIFKFREKLLKETNVYPEPGDVILFNERFHEVDNVQQEQFVGGIPDKSWSIICHTHYSRLSKISLVERQV